jgi:hypothetical protein
LRLAGYELYWFGASEFLDTTSSKGKFTVGPPEPTGRGGVLQPTVAQARTQRLIKHLGTLMTVTDGQRNVAEFKLVGVTAVQGVGFHRLQFSLEVNIAPMGETLARIREPRAFALAGPTQSGLMPLGAAVAETQWFAETNKDATRSYFMVFLDLSGEQLSALERLRGGGPLFFRLDLHTLVESPKLGWQRGLEQPGLEVPLSAWAKLLKDFGYTEILLVALELPVSETPAPLRAAVQQLREAYADFIAARYHRTVGACRLAMDSVDAALANVGQIDQVFQAFETGRSQMTKRQRALLVSGAVRHYTHLGHHLDSSAQLEVFSRQDAQFILAATSAVIWDAVGELQLK